MNILSRKLGSPLRPLTLEDQGMIESILACQDSLLAPYTFPFHYAWQDLFDFMYTTIDDHFCLFSMYDRYIYMPLPPIPVEDRKSYMDLIMYLFEFMDEINNNDSASRMENLNKPLHIKGLSSAQLDREYIYLRKDLAGLKGNKYKSKRALYNFFIKNYDFQYEDLSPSHVDECLDLFKRWEKQKLTSNKDEYFRHLTKDTYVMHRRILQDLKKLNMTGRVVRIDGCVEGYIAGYLRGQTLYIFSEICNPGIKGLSVFIFRKYCEGMDNAIYVNSLGDSQIGGLQYAKMLYKPLYVQPLYGLYKKR